MNDSDNSQWGEVFDLDLQIISNSRAQKESKHYIILHSVMLVVFISLIIVNIIESNFTVLVYVELVINVGYIWLIVRDIKKLIKAKKHDEYLREKRKFLVI